MGYFEIVQELINSGDDLNAQDIFEETYLHIAVSRDNLEIATLLVKNGANINIRDNNQQPPLEIFNGRGAEWGLKQIFDQRLENIEVKRITEFVEANKKYELDPLKILLSHLYKKPFIETSPP